MAGSLPLIDFTARFGELVAEYKVTWEALGFYTPEKRVYPFGTDTKVISTVFEALAAPLIEEIAAEHSCIVETSDQTIYPDFTLTPADRRSESDRIAVDIKTTYRRAPG